MKRLVLLVCLVAGIATAQPATMASRPCRMDGADCAGISGTGVSGRLALWSSASGLTSDAGLTYSGTGTTLTLVVPSVVSQADAVPTTWAYWGTTSNGLMAIGRWSGFGYGFKANYDAGFYSGANGIHAWTATSFGDGTPDTSLSRVAAGVVGVGTGAAGSTAGGLALTSVQYVTGARPTCDATTRGTSWYVAGGAGVADAIEICLKSAADTYAWAAMATP